MNESLGSSYAMPDRGMPVEPSDATHRVSPAERDTPHRDRSPDDPSSHDHRRKGTAPGSRAPVEMDRVEISEEARRAFEQARGEEPS